MNASTSQWKNDRISISCAQYCALLLNLLVTLPQSDSSVEEKVVNYWAEICKLLPRDRKKCYIVHSDYLGCNQITQFTSSF